MNNRQRVRAILHYEPYDRLPLVHFGFWNETLEKWAAEGHVSPAEAAGRKDGNECDTAVASRLGFDCNWFTCFAPATRLFPAFEEKVLEEELDGTQKVLDVNGVVVLRKPGITSIPQEFDHLLKSRREWEEHFLPRLQYTPARIDEAIVAVEGTELPYDAGGLELLQSAEWSNPYGLMCGSLYGTIRNWLGLVGSAYLLADDPDLFGEIIDTVADLTYRVVRTVLEAGARFDFAHFWEDICYNSGPLINPRVFRERVGPHYRRLTDLLLEYGIDIVSVDCDGKIDALLPIWLENGVNTMFPIEVGTWDAEIAPWRAQYGRKLRGVGGMNKTMFSRDRAAIDEEIERLKPLVELGGYIPCPDHRIAPDAEWDNVRYYCDRMRQTFG